MEKCNWSWASPELRNRIDKFSESVNNNLTLTLGGSKVKDPLALTKDREGSTVALTSQTHKVKFLTPKNSRVTRYDLHTDELLGLTLDWGVDEPFVLFVCNKYGVGTVKDIIYKIKRLRDSYFRQHQDINDQRGRLFNHELKKLRKHEP